jgi:hypothetical protein
VQKDGKRIRLLARATSSTPKAELLVDATTFVEEFLEHLLLDYFKTARLAKEIGFSYREVNSEKIELLFGHLRSCQETRARLSVSASEGWSCSLELAF